MFFIYLTVVLKIYNVYTQRLLRVLKNKSNELKGCFILILNEEHVNPGSDAYCLLEYHFNASSYFCPIKDKNSSHFALKEDRIFFLTENSTHLLLKSSLKKFYLLEKMKRIIYCL